MEYLSVCYLEQGENSASLLLQQYQYKKAQVLFACICMGEEPNARRAGGYFTEQLLAWFRGLNLKKLFRHRDKGMKNVMKGLFEVVRRVDRELEDSRITAEGEAVSFAGIFCLEDRYLILRRGIGQIVLINTAFQGAYLQFLGRDAGGCETGREMEVAGMGMEQGIVQPEIGLLLAMKPFYEYVTESMIKEGLAVSQVKTEEQMARHLKELAREGERRGGIALGAILLRSRC